VKKSKTVIAIGIFYIISSILSCRGLLTIDNLMVFGLMIKRYYSNLWYLSLCLFGLVIGIGFLKHKYISWKLAIILNLVAISDFLVNMIFASEERIDLMFKGAINIDIYRGILLVSICFYLLLLGVIYGQKKAFKQAS